MISDNAVAGTNVLVCDASFMTHQGSKKVLPSNPRQVDFPSGQVPVVFHFHLPDGQGIKQVVYQLNH